MQIGSDELRVAGCPINFSLSRCRLEEPGDDNDKLKFIGQLVSRVPTRQVW